MMEPNIRLYNTDVESFISKLPDGHFDLTIADPPYGTGEELIKKAYADSEVSGRCYEAIVRATEEIYKAMEEA